MLQNDSTMLLAKNRIGFDTAENEFPKLWKDVPSVSNCNKSLRCRCAPRSTALRPKPLRKRARTPEISEI